MCCTSCFGISEISSVPQVLVQLKILVKFLAKNELSAQNFDIFVTLKYDISTHVRLATPFFWTPPSIFS
jgi:uncharacterized membrane protein